MTPERILELANHPETPKFDFGTELLDTFRRKHFDAHAGQCHTDSGWYVVRHRSLNPAQRPDHRVLSCWTYGKRVPLSHDVPVPATT